MTAPRLSPDQLIASNTRSRAVLLALAVLVPSGCHAVFERQARRLDALADHGLAATAAVTRSYAETADYAYVVDGATYTWNVKRSEAPERVGSSFGITYLPEEPSFSRPLQDRSLAAREAAANRSWTWKLELALFYFFAVCSGLSHLNIWRQRRVKAGLPAQGPHTGLFVLLLLVAPMLVGVTLFHVEDARAHDEPAWLMLIPMLFLAALFAVIAVYVRREGREAVQARAAKVGKWAAVAAAVVTVLRVVAELLAKP